MFKLNFKIAFRNLWRRRFFSLINIFGLGIGLACCLLLLLYVTYEWSYDRQFKNIDNIYGVAKNVSNGADVNATLGPISNAMPNALAPTALQTMPGLKNISRIIWDYKLLNYRQRSFNVAALMVDPAFLNIFSYKFIQGNPAAALTDASSILITASTAKKLFGTESPIGKVIKWDNQQELKVTAVIEDLPHNQSIQFEALLGWSFFLKNNEWAKELVWTRGYCNVVIELKDKQSFAAADEVLRKMIQANFKEDKFTVPFLFPFSKTHLYTTFENGSATGGKITQVKMFLFLAFCILLIACINYMNLSTAQSEKRAKEVGVRKALGSSRSSIASQFMIESMMLSFLATLVAFVLLEISLPYFNTILDAYMTIDYHAAATWCVLAGLMLFTGFLAGSYPSFYLSSFIPVKVLKGFTNAGKSSLSIRKTLVVVQFSCSVCMIITAIVVVRQIRFIEQKPLGFNQNNLVQIDLTGKLKDYKKNELFKDKLIRSGAVTAATEYSTVLTAGADNSSDVNWEGNTSLTKHSWNMRTSGYDLVKTLGLDVIAGRDFSRKFSSDTSAVLLNETAVKLMGLKEPVGKRINAEGKSYTIIGVLKDYSYESAMYKVKPTLTFLPGSNLKQNNLMFLRLNPAQSLSLSVQQIRAVMQEMNPAFPADIAFIDQFIAEKLTDERLLSKLTNLFGGFAIFISCLGLLGLTFYVAEQRNKEISIRKVLGADPGQILILLNKDFLKLVILSNLIACPVAYIIADQWLSQYDYRIQITIWPMLITFVLCIFVSLLIVSLQTFKVAKANAANALKYD